MRDDRGLEAVRDLSLEVRAGEVVALAGVDGNGQQELVDAIAGLRAPESGRILVGGEDVTGRGVRVTCDAGVAHIAEDRQQRGLVLDFTLAENLALREYRRPPLSRHGWLSVRTMRSRANELLAEYDVRNRDADLPASSLSGGNQQKVCIAREIASNPKLLIAHQPTRGLDVGAIEFVHRRLVSERDQGPGHPARVARVRGGALAGRPHPRDLRGADRGRVQSRRLRGGARDSDDGRPGQIPRVTEGRDPREPGPERAEPDAPAPVDLDTLDARSQTPASRLAAYVRGGGVIVPLLTVLLAFVHRRARGAPRRQGPDRDLRGDLPRQRPAVVLPLGHGRRPHALRRSTCSRR